ncbi:MAG: hypothetical protein JOY65_06895 [Acetobacteraceae bacterium]|nr:hypothetical protein [Acetobacteraceae bacterium]
MSHTLPAHRVGRALGAILGLASVGLAAPVARAVDYPSGGWTQGQPPRLLMSENDGFCFLNRVTGEFRGSGEKVLVYHENGNWYIGGTSQQQDLGGNALCVRWNAVSSTLGATRMISEGFAIQGQHNQGTFDTILNDLPLVPHPSDADAVHSWTRKIWWGDAVSYLAGMSGQFDGGGESISVFQSTDPRGPSVLAAHSEAKDGFMRASGISVFFGQPHSGQLARFWGPNGGNRPIQAAGEYGVNSAAGPADVAMAPYDQAFCFFTRISGKFRGGGEFVSIGVNPSDNRWHLSARHLSGGAPDGVAATAHCVMLHQAPSS